MRRRSKEAKEEILFTPAIAGEAVRDGEMTKVVIKRRSIILTRYDGELLAFDQLCPHAAADLGQGSLHRWRICCHEHDYCFDIRSGRIVWPEDEVYRLRRYEVKEKDGVVLVKIDTSS